MWQRQTEPLMTIFVAPGEMMALSDAIACYLGFLQRIPARVQECAEIIQFLQSFQRQLMVHMQQARSDVQKREGQP